MPEGAIHSFVLDFICFSQNTYAFLTLKSKETAVKRTIWFTLTLKGISWLKVFWDLLGNSTWSKKLHLSKISCNQKVICKHSEWMKTLSVHCSVSYFHLNVSRRSKYVCLCKWTPWCSDNLVYSQPRHILIQWDMPLPMSFLCLSPPLSFSLLFLPRHHYPTQTVHHEMTITTLWTR